jgi:hypothetical protein
MINIEGSQAITWSTSNSGVASINNGGNITASAPGNATITATSRNGISGSVSVRVVPRGFVEPPPSGNPNHLDDTYAGRLGLSQNRLDNFLKGLNNSSNITDVLFVDNLMFLCVTTLYPFATIKMTEDQILTALYIVMNYPCADEREKQLIKAGFTKSSGIVGELAEIDLVIKAYENAIDGKRTVTEYYQLRIESQTQMDIITAFMLGRVANIITTGPGFNPNSGYSNKAALDMLEKNGVMPHKQSTTSAIETLTTSKIDPIVHQVKDFLGDSVRIITNESGDKIFLSEDGLRRVRFDINNPYPHINVHAHIEESINGKWTSHGGQLFPIDVPQY